MIYQQPISDIYYELIRISIIFKINFKMTFSGDSKGIDQLVFCSNFKISSKE